MDWEIRLFLCVQMHYAKPELIYQNYPTDENT